MASESLQPTSRLTRRLAWLMAVWSLLLILAGGLVTTYRVGMAVPDWPTTFGHNMWTYPLDEMLENFGVSVEHTHRLVASALGVFAILTLIAAVVRRERRAVIVTAGAMLAAISAQGILGGTRVLENSPQLAFLHGACAQAVYALVAAFWLITSPAWEAAERRPCKQARPLARASLLALILVYTQIVLGAWLRHTGLALGVILHLVGAFAAVAAVLYLGGALTRGHQDGVAAGHERGALLRVRRWLYATLGLQLALGPVALFAIVVLSGGFDSRPAVAEAISATLHVVVGALLLASTLAAALWSRRLLAGAPVAGTPPISELHLEGAR